VSILMRIGLGLACLFALLTLLVVGLWMLTGPRKPKDSELEKQFTVNIAS